MGKLQSSSHGLIQKIHECLEGLQRKQSWVVTGAFFRLEHVALQIKRDMGSHLLVLVVGVGDEMVVLLLH